MSPVSSANGINSAGETRPRCGCCQRTRASKPTILPVSSDTPADSKSGTPDARSLAAGLFRAVPLHGVCISGVKQRITCLTENLGTIHCCVSITQTLASPAFYTEDNAGTCGHEHLMPTQVKRQRQSLLDLLAICRVTCSFDIIE